MNRVHLAVGNPTGHHDQYAVTLTVDDHTMLRGHASATAAGALADVLRRGCKATGRTFTTTTMKRRKDES